MKLFAMLFLAISLVACEGDTVPKKKYPEAAIEMPLIQVADHTWYVRGEPGVATDNKGFISNAGVVITDSSVVIFDALGTPSLAQALLKQIRTLTDKPVTRVIVSHYHADHIYGLQVFKEAGAKIYAPAGAEEYLSSPSAQERLEERRFSLSPWVNETTYLVKPDYYYDKGESFSEGGVTFTVSMVGAAHSDGDLTLYVDTDKVLFTGDIIFEGRIAYLGDADTRHWLQTLERMETTGLKALIPGHGSAADEPDNAISQTRRYLAFLRTVMTSAFEALQSFDDVYAETDWSAFSDLPAFDEANRRNAYQVFLSIEQEQIDNN